MNRSILAICVVALLGTESLAQTKMSLVIGVDGMGYGSMGFEVASTPNMDSLINGTWQTGYNGGYSDLAYTGGEIGTPTEQGTASGQGWSTILTGVWNNKHQAGSTISSTSGFNTYNVYFETLEENVPGLYSSSVINWKTIDNALNTVNDADSMMDSQQEVDTVWMSPPNSEIRNQEVRDKMKIEIAGLSTNNPAALFTALTVDGPGHDYGSGSAEYRSAIETQDSHIGELLESIANRPTFAAEDWQVIVTSDHGHKESGGHGGQSFLERTIPLIISSKYLGQGDLDLTVLPGETPVSQADVAASA